MDLVEGIERRQSGWPLSAGIQCPAGGAFCPGHSWIAPRSGFLAAARSRVLLLGLRRRGLRRHRRLRLHERYVELPAVSIDSAQRFHSRANLPIAQPTRLGYRLHTPRTLALPFSKPIW